MSAKFQVFIMWELVAAVGIVFYYKQFVQVLNHLKALPWWAGLIPIGACIAFFGWLFYTSPPISETDGEDPE